MEHTNPQQPLFDQILRFKQNLIAQIRSILSESHGQESFEKLVKFVVEWTSSEEDLGYVWDYIETYLRNWITEQRTIKMINFRDDHLTQSEHDSLNCEAHKTPEEAKNVPVSSRYYFLKRLIAHPISLLIKGIDASEQPHYSKFFRDWLKAPNFANVEYLSFNHCDLTTSQLASIFDANLPRLKTLDLRHNNLTDAQLRGLMNSQMVHSLQMLDLKGNNVSTTRQEFEDLYPHLTVIT